MPDPFFMNFYWLKSPLPALAGFLMLWFIRRQDRLDPSSPHFQGSQALDDLGEYLDRELEKKSKGQNRHRSYPLHASLQRFQPSFLFLILAAQRFLSPSLKAILENCVLSQNDAKKRMARWIA
jgi:hypothetical protein